MLNAGERFPELLAEIGGGFVERLQDLLFASGFDLLAGDRVAGLRVAGFECDHVIVSEAGDGAGDDGLCVGALRDFAGEIFGDAIVWLLAHEFQGGLRFGFGEQIQIRRLLELDGEGLLERAIKDGIAGGVDEIGKDDGVFVRERACVPREIDKSDEGDGRDQNNDCEPGKKLSKGRRMYWRLNCRWRAVRWSNCGGNRSGRRDRRNRA